jgi:hypothetical protein
LGGDIVQCDGARRKEKLRIFYRQNEDDADDQGQRHGDAFAKPSFAEIERAVHKISERDQHQHIGYPIRPLIRAVIDEAGRQKNGPSIRQCHGYEMQPGRADDQAGIDHRNRIKPG